MNITLNIEAGSPQELLQAISKLAAGGIAVTATPAITEAQPVVTPVADQPATEKPSRSRNKPAASQSADPTPAPVEETQPETTLATTPEPEQEKPAEPTFTIEQVRAKLADLSKTKQAQVKALISSYNVAKLTDIPAEKYVDLMAKAEQL